MGGSGSGGSKPGESYRHLIVTDWSDYWKCPEPRCQAKAGEHCWSGPPDPKERTGGRQPRKTAHQARQKAAFPEHDKLAAISDKSQIIYDFLEWAREKHSGFFVRTYEGDPTTYIVGELTFKDWLSEFFGINLDKIEAEKRSMLDFIRSMNGDAE
jgi:hypothetical protein